MFNFFPYTDNHQLNLDWILEQIRNMKIQGDVPSYMQNARIFNVLDFGAVADGANDDSQAIQDALDAAIGGGVVYLPAGDYLVTQTLTIPTGITVAGSNRYTTKIIFDTTNSILFDITHTNTAGMVIRDLAMQSNNARDNIAIAGGCDIAEYFSGILTLENLLILDFATGVYGGAVPGEIGIFDSVFRSVWFENCNIGMWCCGSGNLYEHCRFTTSTDGIVLDKLSGESLDGGWMIGCIFVGNQNDIYINNDIRPFHLEGCWFEQSTNGILAVDHADISCPVLSFHNCLLSTHSTGTECLNFYNVGIGLYTVDNCQFFQEAISYLNSYTDSNYSGTVRVTNICSTAYDGTVTIT